MFYYATQFFLLLRKHLSDYLEMTGNLEERERFFEKPFPQRAKIN